MKKITLLIHCKDQKAIIATVTNFIANCGGNIIYLDQHVDADQDVFFMRLECEFDSENWDLKDFKNEFETIIALPFAMSWELYTQGQKPKMAIFVSKYDHCLYDILGRFSAGELPVEIPLIISNHLDLKPISDQFKIPFYYVPFTKENTLINSLQRMASIFYPLLFGIIIISIQMFVYRSMVTALVAVLAIMTINFWANYFGFVRKKRIN